eukprot:TRINITY_DN54828_c0_g1_i1.p1 TRINITY_DN54828_c0_g1~~TRINITY_DN54828_c0_g1_i1.p1  ORF type:complete len:298 (+),score=73.73 TRINITY_DN54828_c0_g1_i1:243-1136(+)
MATTKLEANMARIKHKVLVLSGKGGVGKSTCATQIARSFVAQGFKVGVLDIDICGPSVPLLLGVEDKQVMQCSEGWVPVFVDDEQRLSCMSIGFLLKSREDPVIFRGPKKIGLLRNFLIDTCWGDLDVLVVDCPPGTSDEHITILEMLSDDAQLDGAVIVTTPQEVALADVRKEISFCNKFGLKILGLIENMSGFVCPHCKDCTDIFSSGGGAELAAQLGIRLLGKIPIDPTLGSACEKGENFISTRPEAEVTVAVRGITATLSEAWERPVSQTERQTVSQDPAGARPEESSTVMTE